MRTVLTCLAAAAVLLLTTPAAPQAEAARMSAQQCAAAKEPPSTTSRCAASKSSCRTRSKQRAHCAPSKSRIGSRRNVSKAKKARREKWDPPPRRSGTAQPALLDPAPPASGAPNPGGFGAASPSGTAPSRLFASDSVWNAAVPDSAALDPTSATRMAAFNQEVQVEIARGTGPWITESSYSTPLYTVPSGQPKVGVTLDTAPWGAKLQQALDEGVPIPADANPANGTDGDLTIYQPSSDTLWEFWRTVKRTDNWHASWGGVMRDVSRNPGYYTNAAWPTLADWEGWNWGSTATSLPMIAGTIMIGELRRGRIDHALALDIPDACATTFSWPAQRTDGSLKTGDCLPEGAHLRLDPALDLSTMPLPPMTRILAEAAQRYGIVVRDTTNHAIGFYAEDPTRTGTEPYSGPDGLYGGLAPWNFLPQFPWGRLQVLKMTLCSLAPCRPAAELDG